MAPTYVRGYFQVGPYFLLMRSKRTSLVKFDIFISDVNVSTIIPLTICPIVKVVEHLLQPELDWLPLSDNQHNQPLHRIRPLTSCKNSPGL